MSLNMPLRGKDREQDAEEILPGVSERDLLSGGETGRTARRSLPKSKSQSRADQAINDAQQGLHSLLRPHSGDGPRSIIISSSGAIRNHAHGRVVGPGNEKNNAHHDSIPGTRPYLLDGTSLSTDAPLSLVPKSRALQRQHQARPRPEPAPGKALAAQSLQVARDLAGLLIGSPAEPGSQGIDLAERHASRRAAAQWVTRYATHTVILAVVGALVALGGLKALTSQDYANTLQTVDAYSTDNFGTDQSAGGQADPDSMNFTLTLPRTELGSDNAAVADSNIQRPDTAKSSSQPAPDPARTAVTQYTVVAGDTINSIANKFDVMPETVMGSNGIYDTQEELRPGQVLNIPPVDGMYYVAQQGDTLDTIARRFQAEPGAILSYSGNKIQNGAVAPGQPIVVPGGMMPARDTTLAYTVRPGDTLKGIASRFGVDVPTMLNSNSIPDPDNLKIGSQLRVLPVPGLEYKVQKGDTVNTIADRFGVTPQMLLDYSPNRLTVNSTLQIGQVLMVPGGSPPPPVVAAERVAPSSDNSVSQPPKPQAQKSQPQEQPKAQSGASQPDSQTKPAARPTATPKPAVQPSQPAPKESITNNSPTGPIRGTGSFIWPVKGIITQYFNKSHNGLDIAISAGTPIRAADSGLVTWAGWRTDGLGYCVIIDHLNGYSTVYGHQIRQPAVRVGQYVTQGQLIGWIGSTGRSTGPHVHFIIKGGSTYLNPLSFLGR